MTNRRLSLPQRLLESPRIPLTLALAGVMLAGCHKPAQTPQTQALPPKPATVVGVETHGLATSEEVVGTVRAKLRSTVESKIPGRIEVLLVVPGQAVQANDTLVSLDAREVKARLDSALAVRDQTGRDLERLLKLVRDGAATAAELDAIEARHRVATASVAEAETMLGHTRVVAPFAGVITRKLADVGDLAIPGRPLIEIEDPSRLRIEADVPEALIDKVQLGMKLPVRIGSLPGQIEGVVGEIAPVAEAVSRTYVVKLDLPSTQGLRAGQFGRVSIPTGEAAGLHVPAIAIVQRGQLEYVFVVDAGRAQLRLIRSGRRPNGMVEVVSGLDAGEKVVAPIPADLWDGKPLEVRP
jgi:membrane fusion protein (multidrug efflux system)